MSGGGLVEGDQRHGLLVLHAIRVKGFVDEAGLTVMTGLDRSAVEQALAEHAAEGLMTYREGRIAAWTLTPAGREAHRAQLASELEASGHRPLVLVAYDQFLPINGAFKQVCTDWQLRRVSGRDPVPNHHSDPTYDSCIIDLLADVHRRLAQPLGELEPIARFSRYRLRLDKALARLRAGDQGAFARPLSNSYHDVWMELHEDLLVTLDRTRSGSDE